MPLRPDCTRKPPTITKPAMGISNDYELTPAPYTSDPDPQSHDAGFPAYNTAGVDTMQVNIRGGTTTSTRCSRATPPTFGTHLRGEKIAAWYTPAWMDRYVKGDAAADARLLTDRLLRRRPRRATSTRTTTRTSSPSTSDRAATSGSPRVRR